MFGLHFSRLGSVNILAPINRALSFISALSNSITPQRGSAATFTRSTTATVVDHDSVVRTAKINEARFPGLRRVENLLTYSEDFSNAAWVSYGTTVTRTSNSYAAPDGTLTADTLTIAASSGIYQQLAIAKTSNYLASIYVRGATAQTVDFIINGDNSGVTSTTVTITPQWQRVTVSKLTNSLDTAVSVQLYNSSTGAAFEVWGAQLENVTGQSVQTVGEYVSTNVLSSPYHGAGVDGVKYLTTTLAGAPLSGKFLSEPARTNLLVRSQEFDDAAWTKSTTTVSANNATAPDGGFTADLITSADEVGVYKSIAVTPGAVYTASVFFKKDTCTIYRLRDFSDDHHVVFTVATKTFSSPSNVISYGYQELSDGWLRLWMTFTAVGSFSAHNLRPNSQAGSTSYWQWGAQLEVGNRASSYIPTVASAVTRAADSLSYPVTASPTQGGFSCTLIPAEVPAKAGTYPSAGLVGTSGNFIFISVDPTTGWLYTSSYANYVSVGFINLLSISASSTYKVAITWDSSKRIAVSVNGAAVQSVTAAAMPLDLSFWTQINGANVWNGKISDVKVFTQTLSDNTLRQLTT